MPFIGKDWRAPGETWIRVSHTAGWEQIKLRPIQVVFLINVYWSGKILIMTFSEI